MEHNYYSYVFSVLFTFFMGISAQFEDLDGKSSSLSTRGDDADDQRSAETGFGGGGGAGIENSKYFHYQHLPEHDKYEFGYRRGNDHHVRERHEKAVPHEGHFKTKVRWADHKGGHGEHYWDYNHAGHHDDGDGEGSNPVPSYDSASANSKVSPRTAYKQNIPVDRREFTPDEAVSNDENASEFLKSFQDEMGGIADYKMHGDGRDSLSHERHKKQLKKKIDLEKQVKKATEEIRKSVSPQLFFDLKSGRVVDESTGKTYLLHAL